MKQISIDSARIKLKEMILNDLTLDKNTVIVYNVQAGVGKTHVLVNELLGKGPIAFPNHKLKSEHFATTDNEYANQTNNVLDNLKSKNEKSILSSYYNNGNSFMIKKIIKDVKRSVINDYTFTTHHKIINSKFKTENIFYDEDPTASCLFSVQKYSHVLALNSIKKLNTKEIITDEEYNKLRRFLTSVQKLDLPTIIKKSSFRKNIISKIEKAIAENNINLKMNVVQFLDSTTYSNNSYSYVSDFNNNVRTFIFSATPDITMIKAIAKRSKMKVKVRNIYNVKRAGTIKQVRVNTTRRSLDNDKKLKELLDKNSETTITFKKNKDEFNNDTEVPYGGNSAGFNSLIGKNINVAYTYQLHPFYYYHKYAMIYKKQLTMEDIKMNNRKVEYKKKKFSYYSYENEDLRNLLFDHINNEMIQAVERARTITNNCSPTIYSNFRCSIVEDCNVT
jgi:hypothetical protein